MILPQDQTLLVCVQKPSDTNDVGPRYEFSMEFHDSNISSFGAFPQI